MATAIPIPEAPVVSAGLQRVRLFQLSSATLPVGAFGYSQGLEYAVECGWVHDMASFDQWMATLAAENLVYLEVPVLARLHEAAQRRHAEDFSRCVDLLVASRETREMRIEESARGRAMLQILKALAVEVPESFRESLANSQLAGLAFAGAAWDLPVDQLALAHAWSWLENQVATGIKLVPLGQSDGQRLLFDTGALLPGLVTRGLRAGDDEIGGACPALSIASSLHETQYTRLFRS